MPKQQNYHKQMQKHLRKEKLRKVKKNTRANARPDKPRKRDWNDYIDDEWDVESFYEDERIMPRGSQEIRKETAKAAEQVALRSTSEDAIAAPEDLPDEIDLGLVVEVTSGRCSVILNGNNLECSIRGSLLNQETGYRNVVAVGDLVSVNHTENGSGVVEQVLPRRNVLTRPHRPDVGKTSSFQQIVAANIDRVLIVASWRKPSIWPELIDRYLIAAERNQLEAVICVNKVDLVEDQIELEETIRPYLEAGYQVILTSAETGVGIEVLRELLKDSTTVFTGLSGVGKSSLLSQVQPGLSLRALSIGKRGKNRNQGRHTTTMATLYSLNGSGSVIDTPGIREFGLAFLERGELASYYPEISIAVANCKYADCTHTHEPNCGVKAAVANGRVSQMRYDNYQKILCTLA